MANQLPLDYQSKKSEFQERDTVKYMCTYTRVYSQL